MTNVDFNSQIPDVAEAETTNNSGLQKPGSLSGAILRIPVSVQIVIGTAKLPLAQVTQLVPGSVLTLDEKLGAPARMLVNGREVARGDLFVLDDSDGRLGLTIREVDSGEALT